MSNDIENRLLDKKIFFTIKDVKWIITSGVAVVLWIVTTVLWVKDKNAQFEKIKVLEQSKNQLEKEVATLQGQIKGVENASSIFMENPPSELKYRIDALEKRVNDIEGVPATNNNNNISNSEVRRRNIR